MRSILTVLGITIGIAAVICVVAIGKAGQARVEQQLNNLGDNFVWIEAGGRAVNGVRTGTHDTKTLVMAEDRKSTRLNSSHSQISYAVFCLKKKKTTTEPPKRASISPT